MDMRVLYRLLLVMLVLGGLNMGSMGFFKFNPAAYLLGADTTLLHAFYTSVGLGALAALLALVHMHSFGKL